MKLYINNVGPFSGENEIMLDGITILAGINGTGKSTVGKVLYSFFSAFCDIETQIFSERQRAISRAVWNYLREDNAMVWRSISPGRVSQKIIDSLSVDEGLEEFVGEILRKEGILRRILVSKY